jgi:hypothetical protein
VLTAKVYRACDDLGVETMKKNVSLQQKKEVHKWHEMLCFLLWNVICR